MRGVHKKVVHIIGRGTGWRKAPAAQLTGETWGATQLNLWRSVGTIIDMNDYSENRWGEYETADAVTSKAKALEDGIPYIDLETYPLKEVIQYFDVDYFTNTIDYMIALAIYEHFTQINMYGVNMSMKGEYAFEKPGVDFWCGMALGRGIDVRIFGEKSTIMKSPDGLLYGYMTPQRSIEGR